LPEVLQYSLKNNEGWIWELGSGVPHLMWIIVLLLLKDLAMRGIVVAMVLYRW